MCIEKPSWRWKENKRKSINMKINKLHKQPHMILVLIINCSSDDLKKKKKERLWRTLWLLIGQRWQAAGQSERTLKEAAAPSNKRERFYFFLSVCWRPVWRPRGAKRNNSENTTTERKQHFKKPNNNTRPRRKHFFLKCCFLFFTYFTFYILKMFSFVVIFSVMYVFSEMFMFI